MFNIKYNILVFFQIFLNAINALLLINAFGVSAQVDAYLIAVSIISTIQLLQQIFFEQFLVFYINVKAKNKDSSENFYNVSLLYSAILGILSIGILYIFRYLIFKVFAFNIDVLRLNYLNHISITLFLGTLFMPVNTLNEKLFNAEQKYSIPYILATFPTLFIVIAQIMVYFFHSHNIIYLAYGQTIGWAIAAIFGTLYITRNIIPFKLVYYHTEIIPFFKNSFTIKLSDNIYNVTLPIILNNFLVLMPTGIVSCFYYAKKIIDTLKLLIMGPSSKILKTNLTNCWVEKDMESMKQNTRKFLKGSFLLMFAGMIFTFLVLPFALKIVSMGKLSAMDIQNINLLFISLCPWYLVVLLEAPYILAIFTAKKSIIPILSNSLFIVLFSIMIIMFKYKLGVYVIAMAGFIAQISNYIIFKTYAKKLMRRIE